MGISKNFISKSAITYTAIESDHAMEQINEDMKVMGGITNITQKSNARNSFCSAIFVIASLSKGFCRIHSIDKYERRRSYQSTRAACFRTGC